MYRNLIIILTCLPSISISQTPSKVSDIYDFEIGDVFHYRREAYSVWNSGYFYYLKTVKDKWYSTSKDTLFYKYDVVERQAPAHPDTYWYKTTYEENWAIPNLDSLLKGIDSIYSDPQLYHGRTINRDHSDSIWAGYDYQYVIGCGRAHTYFMNPPGEDETWLVYYNKGSEEWGNKVTVGVEELSLKPDFKVYPNPCNGILTINLSKQYKEVSVIIQDLTGKEILKNEFSSLTEKSLRIDSGSGLYILTIYSEGKRLDSFKIFVR
jgi:hypothetical protein